MGIFRGMDDVSGETPRTDRVSTLDRRIRHYDAAINIAWHRFDQLAAEDPTSETIRRLELVDDELTDLELRIRHARRAVIAARAVTVPARA